MKKLWELVEDFLVEKAREDARHRERERKLAAEEIEFQLATINATLDSCEPGAIVSVRDEPDDGLES